MINFLKLSLKGVNLNYTFIQGSVSQKTIEQPIQGKPLLAQHIGGTVPACKVPVIHQRLYSGSLLVPRVVMYYSEDREK